MEGSSQPRFSVVPSPATLERIILALPVVFGAVVLAILAAKLLLAWRINVNWDEFFYLNHVHALARGELELQMQGAYTHLFRWVAATDLQEVDQVVRLRVLMWVLLVVSAWLLYRIARRFTSPPAAAFAVLAFIGSWPVLKHGASFRADSMLLPLTLSALLFITRPDSKRARDDLVAGLCLAVAFALTAKAALVLPALLAMVLASEAGARLDAARVGRAICRITYVLVTAGIVAALLIAAHYTQVVGVVEPVSTFAARTVATSLLDVPLLPRGDYFRNLVMEDTIFWAAMLAGLVYAIRIRAYVALAGALALLPILFYRNAFPYYYPVMMAPAAILVALAADWLRQRGLPSRPRAGLVALVILGLFLINDAWNGVMTLRFDDQWRQRQVVAAVHQIFPVGVSYIDHSGMIGSFPKRNFFMTSWGVDAYRRLGRNFMPPLLESESPPPLLLVNHGVLVPGTLLYRQLSETDRQLLESSYVDYWGPIKVAGVEIAIPAEGTAVVRVPFAGAYRLNGPAAIQLDGQQFEPGAIIEIAPTYVAPIVATSVTGLAITARLVWADAHPPPEEAPPELPLYASL